MNSNLLLFTFCFTHYSCDKTSVHAQKSTINKRWVPKCVTIIVMHKCSFHIGESYNFCCMSWSIGLLNFYVCVALTYDRLAQTCQLFTQTCQLSMTLTLMHSLSNCGPVHCEFDMLRSRILSNRFTSNIIW